MPRVALLLCALSPLACLGAGTGQAGCPCIEWAGLNAYVETPPGGGPPKLALYPSGEGGTRYWYPSNYGTNECKKWDVDLPPYCAEDNGFPKFAAPGWCQSSWCYVDKADCTLPLIYRSSYFPQEEIYYSYSTCGAKNTFAEWFGSGATQSLHTILDLLNVTGSYVRATRDEIEHALVTQVDSSSGCSLTSGCGCSKCTYDRTWDVDLTFTDTMALTDNDLFRCLGMIVSETYKRVAGQEYDNASRVGYMYMGFQSDGSYMQWPAVSWCPSSYDPRFRFWYAGPAAGPKDIVLVIDVSGSMSSNNRLVLAKGAADAVLDTLTWVDMVSIVAFSSEGSQAHDHLVPATKENIARLKDWIGELTAEGSTQYMKGLLPALQMLTEGRKRNCFTSKCESAVLFLTDGHPHSWAESDYQTLRNNNPDNLVRIFCYALGTGANHQILQGMVQDHGGEFHAVPDGGNLNNAMSSYFKFFATRHTDLDIVRWVLYNDLITGREMLTGCLPLYDRRGETTELMGVTCMDINVIADLADLRRSAGWNDFARSMEANSRQCGHEPGRVLTGECDGQWEDTRNTLANSAPRAGSSALALALAALWMWAAATGTTV